VSIRLAGSSCLLKGSTGSPGFDIGAPDELEGKSSALQERLGGGLPSSPDRRSSSITRPQFTERGLNFFLGKMLTNVSERDTPKFRDGGNLARRGVV
jgi:hypothetical protein